MPYCSIKWSSSVMVSSRREMASPRILAELALRASPATETPQQLLARLRRKRRAFQFLAPRIGHPHSLRLAEFRSEVQAVGRRTEIGRAAKRDLRRGAGPLLIFQTRRFQADRFVEARDEAVRIRTARRARNLDARSAGGRPPEIRCAWLRRRRWDDCRSQGRSCLSPALR